MKSIVGIFPVLFLIAGSAYACPDFSGKYVEVGGNNAFTIVQTGCESWTWLSDGAQPWAEKFDGNTYVIIDDGHEVVTDEAGWDGAKIVGVGELRMKDAQPPKNVAMSIKDEYSLEANGDLTLVETQIDNLLGEGAPTVTTHTYKRVQ